MVRTDKIVFLSGDSYGDGKSGEMRGARNLTAETLRRRELLWCLIKYHFIEFALRLSGLFWYDGLESVGYAVAQALSPGRYGMHPS